MKIIVGPTYLQRLLLPRNSFYLHEDTEIYLSALMFNGRASFTLVLPKDPSTKILCVAALCLMKDYPSQYEMVRVGALVLLSIGELEPKRDLLDLVRKVEDTPLLPVEVRIGMILSWITWGSAEF